MCSIMLALTQGDHAFGIDYFIKKTNKDNTYC